MRMFLIGMCDIFLILYLTAIANVQPTSVLTMEDFYTLKQQHEQLQADTKEKQKKLQEKIVKAQTEKDQLTSKLDAEKNKIKKIEKSLSISDTERAKINKDLQDKVDVLKRKEESLAKLNEEIKRKEAAQRNLEETFQKELKDQEKIAFKALEEAKAIKEEATAMQKKAMQEKAAAEQKASAALKQRTQAEAAKKKALQNAAAAKTERQKAEQQAQQLAEAVQQMKQSGETAYNKNIRPRLQTINITYERDVSNDTLIYERELTLLPVKVDGQVYGIFPSKQIGFLSRSDKAPDKLVMTYQKRNLKSGWINKEDDLVAILLPGYTESVYTPYPPDTPLTELMPALLSVRNNGNVSLADKIRNLSDSYFIVNRDYLEPDDKGGFEYTVSGFRGTGTRAERVVRGDQLVDLNGRLIGIASETDYVVRLTNLNGWEKFSF